MKRFAYLALILAFLPFAAPPIAQEVEPLELPEIEDVLLDVEEPMLGDAGSTVDVEVATEIGIAVSGSGEEKGAASGMEVESVGEFEEELLDLDDEMPVEAINLDMAVTEEPIDMTAEDEPILDLTAETPAPVTGGDTVETDPILDLFGAGTEPAVVPEPAVAGEMPPSRPVQPIDVDAASQDSVSTLIGQEEIKRRAFKDHLRDTLARGDQALQQGWSEDAIGYYEEALRLVRLIGDRPEDRPEKEAAQAGLAETLYRYALHLKTQQDYERALDMARRAVGEGHKTAAELAGELREIIENPPVVEPPEPQPRWRDTEYLDERDTIAELLRFGREHYAVGELEKAKAMYETVLARDPENTEAIRMIEKISNKEYDVQTRALEATRREMMADVRRTWNRDYQISIEEKDIWKSWRERQPKQPVDSDRLQNIEKMRKIRIPEIDFRQANIHDVIDFLQKASVEFDATTEGDENRGVNIILNLAAGQPPAAPSEPEDPFAMAAGDEPQGEGADVPLITFSARYVSLYEALKIVTDVANLKFRVTGSIVMVLRRDAPEDAIIHRRYDVLPTLRQRVEEVQPDLGASSRRSGDFIELTAEPVSGGPTDWKQFFSELGVTWPAGSSINYVPSIGKLIVANTPENLTTFEQVLAELNIVPYQIEIEARFVEVAQTDLDAIGFQWNLTDDWEVAYKEGSGNNLGNTERIVVEEGDLTKGLRYAADLPLATDAINDNLLTVASVLTNPELSLVIHALSQSGNTDLLSAPKVTTKSGHEATFKVVTEYIYPTAYDIGSVSDRQIDGGGNNNIAQINIPISEPSDFETREVGVVLSVLPEVSPEGQMINLEMRPEVVGEPEWRDYGYTVPVQGESYRVPIEQPFFPKRSVQTSILVYNGATVVMGGMITEQRTTVDDKIPFLGDIPIIGRLFRSKMDNSQKRNLLIFVTARLVDPAGRPVKRADTALGDKLAAEPTGGAPAEL